MSKQDSPKTLKQLRDHLRTKMKKNPSGGWINPFSENNSLHLYPSYAIDEAVRYFTTKTLGEERREKELGPEWKSIQ